MKKKILTAVAVCALSGACVFGATACNKDSGSNSGGEPSVQVTEEQWNAAFNKTEELISDGNPTSNYTLTVNAHMKSKGEGHDSETKIKRTQYKVGNESYVYDITTYSGGQEEYKEYRLIEDSDIYEAVFYDGTWNVHLTGVSEDGGLNCYPYSSFTYENGKYSGTVTTEYEEEVKVSVKINADGYIFYMYTESSYKDETSEGMQRTEYTFTNIGTTTYTFPAEAKQAVADYKAANN